MAGIPDLSWYKTFIWSLDILTPLIALALLWAFERVRGPLPRATKAYWLGMVAAAVTVVCVTTCYFVWERPVVPTLAEPDFALTCWLFCGTLKPGFALLAFLSGLLIAGFAILTKQGLRLSRWAIVFLGIVTLPIGFLLLLERNRTESLE